MPWSISCFLILSLSCLLYALYHFFLRCFGFCLSSFLIHVAPLTHLYPCPFLSFLSLFFLAILSIHVKRGESILESLLDSCTFVREKFHKGDAYTKREKTFFNEKTLFCFVLLYVCLLVLLYGALSLLVLCFFVLTSCLYVGHAYILVHHKFYI